LKTGVVGIAAAVAIAACAKPAPPAAPAPEPPVAELGRAPDVRAVAGRYALTTETQRGTPGRRSTRPGRGQTPLRLDTVAAVNAEAVAGVARQYLATVTVPGYSAGSRGVPRSSWYPIAGDSVVIQAVGAQGNRIQLRGALASGVIRGEVWITTASSGSTYQIGTFTATRTR
jgi:hypothetical protein